MDLIGTYYNADTQALITVTAAGIEFFRVTGPRIQPWTCTRGELVRMLAGNWSRVDEVTGVTR